MKTIWFGILLFILFPVKEKVIVIGDSITSNGSFIDELKEYDCAKYGYPGKSSTAILTEFKKLNLSSYQIVIIEAGINNIDNLGRVILDLQSMFDYAKRKKLKVVVLTLVPFKGYPTWTEEKQKNLDFVNLWLKSKPRNVDYVVDIHIQLADENGMQKNSIDFLHPNKLGHKIIGTEIAKVIGKNKERN